MPNNSTSIIIVNYTSKDYFILTDPDTQKTKMVYAATLIGKQFFCFLGIENFFLSLFKGKDMCVYSSAKAYEEVQRLADWNDLYE